MVLYLKMCLWVSLLSVDEAGELEGEREGGEREIER